MSLLTDSFEPFVILDKTTTNDGYGGYTTVWKEGATISGALAIASEQEVVVAGASGEKTTHTLLVERATNLDYHDVLKRKIDGKIFRVTKSGDEVKTPKGAGLRLRKNCLESWELPTEVSDG